jgi:hypothetical protein
MAREGSKRQIAIDVMTANADKPMIDVLPIIVEKCGLPNLGTARAYYKNLCENFGVPGKVDSARAPAAPKEPKVKAEKPTKDISIPREKKVRVAASDIPADAKSPEEIEAIRNANLERIKEVRNRMIAEGKLNKKKKAEEPAIEPEMANEADHPEMLTRDQLAEIL